MAKNKKLITGWVWREDGGTPMFIEPPGKTQEQINETFDKMDRAKKMIDAIADSVINKLRKQQKKD